VDTDVRETACGLNVLCVVEMAQLTGLAPKQGRLGGTVVPTNGPEGVDVIGEGRAVRRKTVDGEDAWRAEGSSRVWGVWIGDDSRVCEKGVAMVRRERKEDWG